MIVGLMHIWETGTSGIVLSAQRMLGEEVDMVGDDHEVANLECWIHATSSIGYKEGLDANLIHHTDGEGHLFHVISLIIVETSLHRHDIYAAKFSENQFSGVPFNG